MAGNESVRRVRQRKRGFLLSVGVLTLPFAAVLWVLLSGLPGLGMARSAITIAVLIGTFLWVLERLATMPLRIKRARLAEMEAKSARLELERALLDPEQHDLARLWTRLEEERETFLVRELLEREAPEVADSPERGHG